MPNYVFKSKFDVRILRPSQYYGKDIREMAVFLLEYTFRHVCV